MPISKESIIKAKEKYWICYNTEQKRESKIKLENFCIYNGVYPKCSGGITMVNRGFWATIRNPSLEIYTCNSCGHSVERLSIGPSIGR